METIKKYKLIIVLTIGFILGCLMTCSQKDNLAEVKEKTIVKYIPKTTTDTITVDSIQVKYKYKDRIINNTMIDSFIQNFKPSDYNYTYDKTIFTKNNKQKIDLTVKGWGNLDKMEYIITDYDTIKETTTTIEKTFSKTPNQLYLGASYDLNKRPAINLDYTIKGKVIIGTFIQYDNIQPQPFNVGLKIGIKL